MTSKVNYLGDLRTSAIHIASAKNIITDAPIDNQGKGEAFSPTDTVATALASCLLTIMGIKARDLNIDIKNTTAEVAKIMTSKPRRISEIQITVNFTKSYDQRIKKILEKAALACPVSNSLHPDLKQNILFNWPS
ncbi:MAG: osmotically inducible protein OsmC [Flavobacteriaceae bacterium]|nr:osmotically inducible protein OsmC [Flavobacteriaceae bacterium]|tara:strand:+ start:1348 stop:1752 length:405 start_codon:yes stop_codon:yes gene_type:complete